MTKSVNAHNTLDKGYAHLLTPSKVFSRSPYDRTYFASLREWRGHRSQLELIKSLRIPQKDSPNPVFELLFENIALVQE